MKQTILACCLAVATSTPVHAAVHNSTNFTVSAETPEVARKIAEAAEARRAALMQRWFHVENGGHWASPCHIRVIEQDKCSGWTSYTLRFGEAQDLQIIVRGHFEDILESILPHEVAHAVLVASLGRPLPRWADEGVALLSESETHRARMRHFARDASHSEDAVSLTTVLTQAEYPQDHGHLHHFYAASLSLTEFLLTLGGNDTLFRFASEGEREGWDTAVKRHYSVRDVAELESAWRKWESSSVVHVPTETRRSMVASTSAADGD